MDIQRRLKRLQSKTARHSSEGLPAGGLPDHVPPLHGTLEWRELAGATIHWTSLLTRVFLHVVCRLLLTLQQVL